MDSYDKLEGRVKKILKELDGYYETALSMKTNAEASNDFSGSDFFSGEASAYYRAKELLEKVLGGDEE